MKTKQREEHDLENFRELMTMLSKQFSSLRAASGDTYDHVARITGISKSSLLSIEKDQKNNIELGTLYSLSRYFNVRLTEILRIAEAGNDKDIATLVSRVNDVHLVNNILPFEEIASLQNESKEIHRRVTDLFAMTVKTSGMSYSELAKRSGMSVQGVSSFFTSRETFTLQTIFSLGSVFDLKLSAIFDLIENIAPSIDPEVELFRNTISHFSFLPKVVQLQFLQSLYEECSNHSTTPLVAEAYAEQFMKILNRKRQLRLEEMGKR